MLFVSEREAGVNPPRSLSGTSGRRAVRFAARGGAAAAELREFFVAGLVAHLGAGIADFSARAAGDFVELGMPEHEVVRGVGHLRAVEQDADVLRAGVRPALFQAVVDSVLAGVVNVFTGVDALVHFGSLMFVNVGHGFMAFLFLIV